MDNHSTEQKKVIEQVQKLLALSKSSNENEAALALAKAEELLEKYRLDMTAIEMMTGQKEGIVQDDDPIFDTDEITQWESKLSHSIAWLYGCTTIRLGTKMIKIIGRPSDIIFVRYMVTYITIELFRLSVEPLYKKRKDYKDSWFLGAVDVILYRLKESKAKIQETFTNPFAVATVNNRYNESQAKLNELYPNATKSGVAPSPKFSSAGYNQGQIAGHKVKLSHDKALTGTKSTLT